MINRTHYLFVLVMIHCNFFLITTAFPKSKYQINRVRSLHVRVNDSINPQGKFNWNRSQLFWGNLLKLTSKNDVDSFLFGDNEYGITNLKEINLSGLRSGEYESKDTRYTKTKTYALRFGYNGIKFYGYQSQRNVSIQAVEDVIHKVIKKTTVAAGRTDKGVSSLSQIISFSTPIENFDKTIIEEFKNEKVCQDGDLVIYDCVRVPRKFNGNYYYYYTIQYYHYY